MTHPLRFSHVPALPDPTTSISPRTRPVPLPVPVGTVHSRVKQLQRLVASSADRSSSPFLLYRRGEKSGTGFGRGTTGHFAPLAALGTLKPDGNSSVEVKHRYRDYKDVGGNHPQPHRSVSMADMDRTAGLHGQLRPRGQGSMKQYDATSPWTTLPKDNLEKSQTQHEALRRDLIIEASAGNVTASCKVSSSGLATRLPSISSGPRSSPRIMMTGSEAVHAPKCKLPNIPFPEPVEDSSGDTTPTTRCQSVRDLYDLYGIGRPEGLASADGFDSEQEIVICHICHWNNRHDAICLKCGHTTCKQCITLPVQQRTAEKKQSHGTGNDVADQSPSSRRERARSYLIMGDDQSLLEHKRDDSNDVSSSNESKASRFCDSPSCRATHRGYRPYRHSISCTTQERRNPVSTSDGRSNRHNFMSRHSPEIVPDEDSEDCHTCQSYSSMVVRHHNKDSEPGARLGRRAVEAWVGMPMQKTQLVPGFTSEHMTPWERASEDAPKHIIYRTFTRDNSPPQQTTSRRATQAESGREQMAPPMKSAAVASPVTRARSIHISDEAASPEEPLASISGAGEKRKRVFRRAGQRATREHENESVTSLNVNGTSNEDVGISKRQGVAQEKASSITITFDNHRTGTPALMLNGIPGQEGGAAIIGITILIHYDGMNDVVLKGNVRGLQ